jgi:YcaO-like protein with predicted kinase domain
MRLSAAAALFHGHGPKKVLHGTHRSVDPVETWKRVRPFAREMGITRIGNITGLDRIGIPVATAIRPHARNIIVTQGKGLDLCQALTSALMEACELFHAEDVGPCKLASYRKLAAIQNVIDPRTLCLGNRQLNLRRPLRWVEGFDLQQQRRCWVPAEVVEADYARSQPDGYFLMGSNGLASGNLFAEAVNTALYELIERDAVALWVIKPTRERVRCAMDLSSVDDDACRILLEKYVAAQIAVRIYNVTTDIGIAAFLCEIRDLEPSNPTRLSQFYGAGCHVDRRVALAHAMMEAAQSRLTYTAGVREDLSPKHYPEEPNSAIRNAFFDALSREEQPVAFSDAPTLTVDDLHRDLRWTLERLRIAGLERAIAVDLTRPRFDIPVVRVIVPGLEWDPLHPEYRPGIRARAQAQRSEALFAASARPASRDQVGASGRLEPELYIRQCFGWARQWLGSGIEWAHQWLGPRRGTPSSPARSGTQMRVVVFVGSTLPRGTRPLHEKIWDWQPPAQYGDVYRAALTAPDAIGVIDGYFDSVPTAFIGEFLWAMAQGIHVFGAASIGALRAVELGVFGMRGVGKIYDDYRNQPYTDDEEIAVIEAPMEDYLPSDALVDAMVNVRATLKAAEQQKVLAAGVALVLTDIAKSLSFRDRTYETVIRHARGHGLPTAALDSFEKWLPTGRVYQKRLDAEAMLAAIKAHLSADRCPLTVNYEFVETAAWAYASHQMVQASSCLPSSTR